MRLNVGTVKYASRFVLAGVIFFAVFALLFGPVSVGAGDMGGLKLGHLAVGYACTLLCFSSFPKTRRTDASKALMLAGLALELAMIAMGRHLDFGGMLSDALGIAAVFVPSFVERFRSLVRQDPFTPFSIVYPNDRRRRARSPRSAQSRVGST